MEISIHDMTEACANWSLDGNQPGVFKKTAVWHCDDRYILGGVCNAIALNADWRRCTVTTFSCGFRNSAVICEVGMICQ
eukprot:71643-Amphidinium_carterae.1